MFSILFIQVFSFTPYRNAVLVQHEHPGTIGRAVLDTLNQADIFRSMVYMYQIIFQKADEADFQIARKEYGPERHSDGDGNGNGDGEEYEADHSDSVVMDEVLQNLNSNRP